MGHTRSHEMAYKPVRRSNTYVQRPCTVSERIAELKLELLRTPRSSRSNFLNAGKHQAA